MSSIETASAPSTVASASASVELSTAAGTASAASSAVSAATGVARIARALEGGEALVPFVTCGDPDLETTEELVVALAGAGAALVELGIPFSDPTAEGPEVQAANLRALVGGATVDKAFQLVKRVRERTDVPLAFVTYANVVFCHGVERFARRMAEAGVDALVLPDIPFEEKEEFAGPCRAAGVAFASMVAPTSGDRVQAIAQGADGLVCCALSLGAVGAQGDPVEAKDLVERVRRANPDVPCLVDAGTATPEDAAPLAAVADGIVVGGAIVRLAAEHGRASAGPAAECLRTLKAAIAEAAGRA